jgi:VWFA-related protein
LGHGLQQLQALTADRAVVSDSIRRRVSRAGDTREAPLGYDRTQSSTLTEETLNRMADQAAGRSLEPGEVDGAALYFWDRLSRVQRAQSSLGALRAIVDALGLVEGRKVLVLFSEGFHTPTQSESELRDDTISAANRTNVSIYGVDATGLTLERRDRDAGSQFNSGSEGVVTPDAPGILEDFMAAGPQANLRLLSSQTGGFATTSTERLPQAPTSSTAGPPRCISVARGECATSSCSPR